MTDSVATPSREAAPGATPRFVIQVAAFRDPDTARDVAALLGRRHPEYPTRVAASENGLHRVWLGGWETREQAAAVLDVVRQRYPEAWILSP